MADSNDHSEYHTDGGRLLVAHDMPASPGRRAERTAGRADAWIVLEVLGRVGVARALRAAVAAAGWSRGIRLGDEPAIGGAWLGNPAVGQQTTASSGLILWAIRCVVSPAQFGCVDTAGRGARVGAAEVSRDRIAVMTADVGIVTDLDVLVNVGVRIVRHALPDECRRGSAVAAQDHLACRRTDFGRRWWWGKRGRWGRRARRWGRGARRWGRGARRRRGTAKQELRDNAAETGGRFGAPDRVGHKGEPLLGTGFSRIFRARHALADQRIGALRHLLTARGARIALAARGRDGRRRRRGDGGHRWRTRVRAGRRILDTAVASAIRAPDARAAGIHTAA